ncbi:serine hydrolase domain-containing protein [Pantanalinema sp. GBBB05]|uniref:serine hydrolase domain-containing protein n=1 Tax=Pantanalinema sp. GBBB05 TaxID=2604139 RepID=UPI001DB4A0BF|nr:beta-lactamase family protein [Pantanalinema sp. GBBB05]
MRLRYRLLLLGTLIMMVFQLRANAVQLTLEMKIDRFITHRMTTQHIPGLALAITHENQVMYVKGYGKANTRQLVTPQTQFPVASLSKSFTAIAVLQLVEAGQIDLDAPVKQYLPDFTLADTKTADQITIRHLLNHISGLSDFGFSEAFLPQPTTHAERVESLHNARPVAAPGTQFHYFNPNYDVLARVVEVVSGQSFAEYLRSCIFTPLQMSETFHATTMAEALQRGDRMATGHLMAFAIPFAAQELSGYLGGNAGAISTAEDMAKYLILHSNEGRFEDKQLLTSDNMALMHTPPPQINSPYAMGWFVTTENGRKILQHNGILSTFYTDVTVLPNEKYGIALLYSISGSSLIAFALPQIKTGLIQLLTDGTLPPDGFSINLWGISLAVLTVIGVALAVRSLLYFSQWKRTIHTTPKWQIFLSIAWMFFPFVIVLVMPWLVGMMSDRIFNYQQLFRAMPDVILWLGLCAGLGSINGTIRLIACASNRQS